MVLAGGYGPFVISKLTSLLVSSHHFVIDFLNECIMLLESQMPIFSMCCFNLSIGSPPAIVRAHFVGDMRLGHHLMSERRLCMCRLRCGLLPSLLLALCLAHFVTEYRARKSFPSTLKDGMSYARPLSAKVLPPVAKFL